MGAESRSVPRKEKRHYVVLLLLSLISLQVSMVMLDVRSGVLEPLAVISSFLGVVVGLGVPLHVLYRLITN